MRLIRRPRVASRRRSPKRSVGVRSIAAVSLVTSALFVMAPVAGVADTSEGASAATVARSATRQTDTTPPESAQSSAQSTTTVPASGPLGRRADRTPGRVAFVRPSGEVVVAESDGSGERVIGAGAVANRIGLAPLAWRQPSADAVTYVRNDRALVIAPIDGSPSSVVATDAVVPADADESILSWDLTGTLLVYLAEPRPGRIESRVVDFSAADATTPPAIRTIGTPDRRLTLAQSFSPIDPIIYQRTVDPDTGREFTISISEPISGRQFGTPYTLDDATFTPDGRYIFAVSKGTGAVQQLVRLSVQKVGRSDLVVDRDRVCRPRVSPTATEIVFASGPDCREIWMVNADGTDPRRIVAKVAPSASFEQGEFTWSGDGKVISHAACTKIDGLVRCDGGYWNIAADGSSVQAGAEAGSVIRESRALLKPVKLTVSINGAVELTTKMQVGTNSVGQLLSQGADDVVDLKAVDEADNARSVELKLVREATGGRLAGTIRVIDGPVDETFPFFGGAAPRSYGFAALRGIWLRSERLPLESGQILVTLER